MPQFEILVDDGSEVLPNFAIEQNENSMELYDWQRRGIDYFFKYKKAIFEVCTGCLTGDTFIDLPRDLIKYPNGIKIKNLVGKKNFFVYTFNIKKQKIELKKVKQVWLNKKNQDVFEVKTAGGKIIKTTLNHPFLVDIKQKPDKGCGRGKREQIIRREYKELKDLKIGDYLTTFNRTKPEKRNKDGEYIRVNFLGNTRRILEHRFIIEEIDGKIETHNSVHHKNNNRFDNTVTNLKQIHNSLHTSLHDKENKFFGKKLWEKNGHPKGMKGKKHTELTKLYIKKNTKLAVNNLKYKQFRTKKISDFKRIGYDLYKTEDYISRGKEKMKKTLSLLNNKERCSENRKVRYSDKIISIKYKGKEDVYDMEVEDNHNFIANGIFVHNSGKTYCAIEIIKKIWEEEPNLKVLIVVPKNVILETGWYKELYDAGISIKDIGVYYGNIKEYGKVTITNMQNIHKVAMEIFGMVIFDEVHNYGTERLLPFVEYDMKYKLGLSATVMRMDGAHWKILEIFDYNIFKYTPQEALYDGVLNPFYFTNIGVEMDSETFNDYNELTADLNLIYQMGGGFNKIMRSSSGLKMRMLSKLNERKELVNNYFRKFDIAKEICNKHRNDKIIVFNQFNAQTNKLYWHLLDVGIKARVIHSDIQKDKRDETLIDFKNDKFNVLLTSKVLDEGYNLPKIDTAIIMAGDSTSKQTVQRLGRVLRKKSKHSHLYQIYCLRTIEEEYARERSILFKTLSSDYNEYIYNGEDKIFEDDIKLV